MLGLLERRTFRKVEFAETSDGHVRLRRPLTHELAETMPSGPVPRPDRRARRPCLRQGDGARIGGHPLTRAARRDAQAVVKARKVGASSVSTPAGPPAPDAQPVRSSCGPVPTAAELSRTLVTSAARPASPPTRRRRPRSGAGGSCHRGPEAGAHGVGQGQSRHGLRPELFRREILPRLETVPLAEIMEAAGCCKASASDYRRGKRTPQFRRGALWRSWSVSTCRDASQHKHGGLTRIAS